MAAVVFALVIVGLMGVFMAASKYLIHARERMASGQLGKLFLDPLQVYVRQDHWLDPGPGNGLAAGTWAGITQSINNRSFTESHTVSLVINDLRRVTSTISWTEPSS